MPRHPQSNQTESARTKDTVGPKIRGGSIVFRL